MVSRTRRSLLCFALAALVVPTTAPGASEHELAAVLSRPDAPPGVVFEVVSGDERQLQSLTPVIKAYARQLRARFPDLEIALVTHGSEQFSLLSSNAQEYATLHSEIEALIEDEKVPVHVCGNHAGWRNNTAEDFPKYIDVAPSASGQLSYYTERGFVLIVL